VQKAVFLIVLVFCTLAYLPLAFRVKSSTYEKGVRTMAALVYPMTGLDSHPVFVDELLNYPTETRITYRSDAGQEQELGLTDAKGHPNSILFERAWCMWLFGAGSHTVPSKVREGALARFAFFAARRAGANLRTGRVVVYERSLHRSFYWVNDLPTENESVQWREVATARAGANSLTFTWRPRIEDLNEPSAPRADAAP
jgi:hypothetical protein